MEKPNHIHLSLRYVTLRYVTLRYVTLRYVTLRYVTLRYVTSRHVTSRHLTSPHLTSPHLTSPHLTSPHLTSPHLTSPYLSTCSSSPTVSTQVVFPSYALCVCAKARQVVLLSNPLSSFFWRSFRAAGSGCDCLHFVCTCQFQFPLLVFASFDLYSVFI